MRKMLFLAVLAFSACTNNTDERADPHEGDILMTDATDAQQTPDAVTPEAAPEVAVAERDTLPPPASADELALTGVAGPRTWQPATA